MSTHPPEPSHDRRSSAWFIGILAVLFWLPLLTMPLTSVQRYGPEPVPFPSFMRSWKGIIDYPTRLQAWFETHFGLRAGLIRGHSLFCHFVLGMSPNPKVVYGQEGWMYYNGDPANRDYSPLQAYRAEPPLSPRQREHIRWLIQDQAEWLEARGISYLFVLVPSKAVLRPDFLPASVVRGNHEPDALLFARHMAQRPELPFLDLAGPLLDAQQGHKIFSRTESHWTDYGAFTGTRAIIERINLPGTRIKSLEDYQTVERMRDNGDLLRMTDLTGVIREPVTFLIPRFSPRSAARAVGDHELPDIIAGTGDSSQPTAVVFRDSFTTPMIPFLSESFQTIRYVWARGGAHITGIEEDNPSTVVQIMSDRSLRLNLRYAPEIRLERTLARFATSEIALLNLHAPADFAGLIIRPESAASVLDDGVVVHVDHNEPMVALPLMTGIDRYLPIMKVEIDAPARGGLTLHSAPGAPGDLLKELVPLQPGRNTIYYTVIDPEAAQPLHLSIGGNAGGYTIRSVEVRGHPR